MVDVCYQEILTQQILKKMFRYDATNGTLSKIVLDENDPEIIKLYGSVTSIRIRNSLLNNKNGSIRENKAGNKYLCFKIQFNNHKLTLDSHRIIWVMEYGYWPTEIDHLDGNGLNNCLGNLRDVDRVENNKNHRKQSNSSSGISGISFRKDTNKWRAYSFISNPIRKQVGLGVFDNLFDAVCVRISWQNKNGFTLRHGS